MAKMKERIGLMRHRVTLMQPTFSQNDFGEKVPAWVEYGERWARFEFRELRSDEKEDGNRLTSFVYARLQMRLDENITAQWRLKYNGEEYDILTIIPYEKGQYMLVECERDAQTRTE